MGPIVVVKPPIPPWAKMSPERLAHVERVVGLIDQWALAIGVPDFERRRWLRAAWLHDALRDAGSAELAQWAPGAFGSVELWHGPAAASRAAAEGETDQGILDAVRFHSVGLNCQKSTGIRRLIALPVNAARCEQQKSRPVRGGFSV